MIQRCYEAHQRGKLICAKCFLYKLRLPSQSHLKTAQVGSGEGCFRAQNRNDGSSRCPNMAASRMEGIFLPTKVLTFTWIGPVSSPEMGDGGGAHLPKTSVPQVMLGCCKMEQIPWRRVKTKDKIITYNFSVKKQVQRGQMACPRPHSRDNDPLH